MRLFLFVLIFLTLEVVSVIKVGGLLGALSVIGLLAVDLIIGGVLLNLQNQRLRTAMLRGLPSGVSPLNALIFYPAAFLFAFPGFFSDFLALLILFPPTRLLLAGAGQHLAARLGARLQRLQRFRVYNFNAGKPFADFSGANSSANPDATERQRDFSDDDIIEGEFRDVTGLRDRDPASEALPGESGAPGREN